jgi:hypothetical protein
MHPNPVSPTAVPRSLLSFELQRVSRQGRLNLQAARAMADVLCSQARRLVPATTVAASFAQQVATDHPPTFVPPAIAFARPIRPVA